MKHMDQHICDLRRPYQGNIRNLSYILVDKQADYRYNFQCTNKWLDRLSLYIDCMLHTVMDDTIELLAFLELSEATKLTLITVTITNEEKKAHTSWSFITTSRWISSVTSQTSTIRWMICNEAFRIWRTNSNAWINTFLIETWFCLGTIAIHYTFRTTFNIRITIVFRQTTAWTSVVPLFTNSIYAAWICLTRGHFGFMIN